MTDPSEPPPPTSARRPIARPRKPPPSGKMIVPLALLVCGGLAFGLYASFPVRRPAVVQPVDSASSLGASASSLPRDAAAAPGP